MSHEAWVVCSNCFKSFIVSRKLINIKAERLLQSRAHVARDIPFKRCYNLPTTKLNILKERINILDVPIDRVDFFGALRKIGELIDLGESHQVCTVNPEFIVHSAQNEDFKHALQESSLNTADGIGIIWASKFLAKCQNSKEKTRRYGSHAGYIYKVRKIFWLKITLFAIIFNKKWLFSEIPERVTGIDLMWELANQAQEREWKVYLLNWDKGRSKVEEVEEKLKTLYPRINIVGTCDSHPGEEGLVEKIAETAPDILFVAFGSPKQEIFIHENLKKLGSKVVIGVGGSFDFVAEKSKRAPRVFQRLGIEWAWRLLIRPTPKRAGRIFNAFPRFVLKVFRSV